MKKLVLGDDKKTSIGGISGALILILLQVNGVLGQPVPRIEDGKPVLTETGELMYDPPPPFDLQTILIAAGFLGLGRIAKD